MDPLVNQATGKPCKGKAAAAVLALLIEREETGWWLAANHPELYALAMSALLPFDHDKLLSVARELEVGHGL